jgi:predicted nucleic acid-binding protein
VSYLIDTNVLLRLSEVGTPASQQILDVLAYLRQKDEELYITPQNLIEFWCSATRPADWNGLGWNIKQAIEALNKWEVLFRVAPDAPTLYTEWRRIVTSCHVSGIQVYDARLVAVMRVHDITHILTLDAGFNRYSWVTVINPFEVLLEKNHG